MPEIVYACPDCERPLNSVVVFGRRLYTCPKRCVVSLTLEAIKFIRFSKYGRLV